MAFSGLGYGQYQTNSETGDEEVVRRQEKAALWAEFGNDSDDDEVEEEALDVRRVTQKAKDERARAWTRFQQ